MPIAQANDGISASNKTALDTPNAENDLEPKREAVEIPLHIIAMGHNFLKMWQGSQNLPATQKESHAHDKQMTVVGNISDNEEIVKQSLFTFSKWSCSRIKIVQKIAIITLFVYKWPP